MVADRRADTDSPNAVELLGVARRFGDVHAVDHVDLTIPAGEFFAMLGPSGSGKTTCLRLIAGFDRPDAGRIRIFGEDMQSVPPWRRHVNTVFQDYALFPHLSVLDNVAFGLKLAGIDRTTRHRRAAEMLDMVRLPDHGRRRPSELSGGQRQRVALARALINEPRVLLLDEPLGALDLKLREQMQEELKSLQHVLGITFVFVTHDQGEALSMADRIAVFNEGRIVQTGTPSDIHDYPDTRFVADFVGSNNVLPPDVVERLAGQHRWASLRPERIAIDARGPHEATVTGHSYLGTHTRVRLDLAGSAIHCLQPTTLPVPDAGSRVRLSWPGDALHLMPDP